MADYYPILDHNGRPIEKPSLLQTLGRANVMGVRQATSSGVTRGLTPQRLASILREAEEGDPERYLELAEEMEERDPHYIAVLGTRKRQVSQLDISVEAASEDDPDDQANADLVNTLNDEGVIDEALFDMLDAVGKGFSLVETMWRFSATLWMPRALEWVDPRFILWDRATRRVPLLRGDAGERLPLTPGKFLFLKLQAKSGIPIRSGIARAIAFNWMCKNFTIKDWIQFLEIYGMPIRVGKYPQGASEDDINALLRAISQIGSDAAGVIPQSMLIEFTKSDAQGTAGPLFAGAADYFDKQTSKLVLGQTGTTDATPGQLGNGQDHTEVRRDIERADARALEIALNRQLIRPFIDLNRGPQKRYPWLYIGRPETKDAKLMAEVANILVPMGARLPWKQIAMAAGFTEPGKGEEILTPSAQAMPGGGALPFGFSLPQAQNATARMQVMRALLAELNGKKPDAIEQAANEMAGDYVILDAAVEQIARALASASTPQEAQANLQKLAPSLDMSKLGERLAGYDFQALASAMLGE